MRILSSSKWCHSTIKEASKALQSGEITAVELTKQCISRIEETRDLNIVVHDTFDLALESAKQSDKRRKEGRQSLGLLDGIPVGFKDNYCMKGVPSSAASKMLHNFIPGYDSTPSLKLLQAGAIPIGKLNMDEFAMGSATVFSKFGPTVNPYSTEEPLVSGGSSGASAAAVATGCCFAALGSDTGGSVRQPAAYCGVVGLKPNYGRVSRYGLIAYASSLDTPGILARTVEDSSIVLNAIAGSDAKDSNCLVDPLPNDWCLNEARSLEGLKIGIPDEYHVKEIPSDILAIWDKGIARLEANGASIVPVSLPTTKYALPAYYIIACAEASSNLSRYDGVRYGHCAKVNADFQGKDSVDALHDLYCRTRSEGFGDEVLRRILSGTFVLSEGAFKDYYEHAVAVRQLIRDDFKSVFDSGVDALLTPTSPVSPFTIESALSSENPVDMYLNDIMTIPASLAGLPAISVPVGSTPSSKIPLGLQLITSEYSEPMLLQIAYSLSSSQPVELQPETGL